MNKKCRGPANGWQELEGPCALSSTAQWKGPPCPVPGPWRAQGHKRTSVDPVRPHSSLLCVPVPHSSTQEGHKRLRGVKSQGQAGSYLRATPKALILNHQDTVPPTTLDLVWHWPCLPMLQRQCTSNLRQSRFTGDRVSFPQYTIH